MDKIVIDTFGADAGAAPVIRGVAKAMKSGMDYFPILVGDSKEIREHMDVCGITPDRYEVIHTQDQITNNEPPTCIFGGCEDTSMVIAYSRLKNDPQCAAMLSAGSTGALLVGSICRLGLLPGLKFPALISALPCNGDNLLSLVDCGSNIECTPEDLVRFARMGNVFAKSYCGIENPRVGLMNVGREKGKGTQTLQKAYELISQLDLNFVGNLEGSDMVSNYADVIVADGFSGNLLLKCAESVGKAAMAIVEAYGNNLPEADKIRQVLFETFDFNSRGAATFLGPKKTVVKMHGNANADTAVASIEQILRLENAQFSQAMALELSK